MQHTTGYTVKSGKITQSLSIENTETGKWHHEFVFFQDFAEKTPESFTTF